MLAPMCPAGGPTASASEKTSGRPFPWETEPTPPPSEASGKESRTQTLRRFNVQNEAVRGLDISVALLITRCVWAALDQ